MPTEREIAKRLFVGRGPMRPTEFAREIMTLGLVSYYKWDDAFTREFGDPERVVTSEELDSFQLTEQRVHDIEAAVATALQDYSGANRPLPGFWYGVWQGMVSAFLYSLLLAAVVIALVFGNVSIPTLLGIDIRTTPASPVAPGSPSG